MARAATAATPASPAKKASRVDNSPSIKMPVINGGDIKKAVAAFKTGAGPVTVMVPPASIRVTPGYNVRITGSKAYAQKILRIRDSIMTEGFYPTKPLAGVVVKDTNGEDDIIMLTQGHGRLEAVKMAIAAGAEITSIPVILHPPGTDAVDLTVALVKENDGEKLEMAETAIVVKRLLKHGMAPADVQSRLDITARYFADIMLLLEAPKPIREVVSGGKIAGTEAVRILRQSPPKDQPGVAEAKILHMVENATKQGKEKATRKDSEEGTKTGKRVEATEAEEGEVVVVKIKPQTATFSWSGVAGTEFNLKDIRPFSRLIGDTDWYSLMSDKEGMATLTQDIKFEAKWTRPAKAEPVVAEPPKKRGRPKKEVETLPVDEPVAEAEPELESVDDL